MSIAIDEIKRQIVAALSHPEAEDGLYFNNLIVVHEDEERTVVAGEEEDILLALKEMIKEGLVTTDDEGKAVIFRLRPRR